MKVQSRHVKGGVLGTVGYLLSPLSFWNDLFINFPLAYVIAFLIALINHDWFAPTLVVTYWATNVLGFVLMRHGYQNLIHEEKPPYAYRTLITDLLISVAYSLLIIVLIMFGILRFPTELLALSSKK